ncbi:D-isomer specific 2-hydroxyacid dehydrogenase NAD-binding protein [Sulfuricurvum kujiense DSM 16994]|uniref:D-isomer specific 2-hydroxyacid dehydrogenase NAD-binding protein n=1 Tax=Sulfuricurvum kujiense (strain ATCC BAA-921 / DSM 16994 / JCM 11577 / YK-1) TaxID=709032 RepID=E4TYB3_SULKY|nr:phosphoglycerate dehydrogenase [Sulfuricurvum kujiense]ADR35058.1 D-isomer specific 2-hydroxyacid dehydrogenase NAD-binding protein [Sulfuricurvum kujiense DSM 16994]
MKIIALSPSFSKNETLQKEFLTFFPDGILNTEGKRFSEPELIAHIHDADAIIVGLEEINDQILSACPNLKIISKYGVGLNNIDLDACRKRGVQIGWTGGVNRLSVAEMALGYMLMLCRNLYITSNELKNGIWNKSGGFQLSGKTVGIIGVGHIGKELIRLLQPFGCTILVNDIIDQSGYYKKHNLIEATKEALYAQSDIVTIHTPLDDTTNKMINRAVFEQMKSSAFILNSARGGIIDENDLKFALQNRLIAGAAIDAYIEEPPSDTELLTLPNLICTPHIGGNAIEAVEAMGFSAIHHVREYFNL